MDETIVHPPGVCFDLRQEKRPSGMIRSYTELDVLCAEPSTCPAGTKSFRVVYFHRPMVGNLTDELDHMPKPDELIPQLKHSLQRFRRKNYQSIMMHSGRQETSQLIH
jgi:hypothetical protein